MDLLIWGRSRTRTYAQTTRLGLPGRTADQWWWPGGSTSGVAVRPASPRQVVSGMETSGKVESGLRPVFKGTEVWGSSGTSSEGIWTL